MYDNSSLEEKIGYSFDNKDLLTVALTHSSYVREKKMETSLCNERLEFLGDAFFDAIIGEEMYQSFPDSEEGFLSRIRATLVCEKSLARVATGLDLGGYLRIGRGEEKTGGRQKESLLADAMEAIIGAIYLDSGYEAAKKAVLKLFDKAIEDARRGRYIITDYKTALQEHLQAKGITDIRYVMTGESGPDHNKTFHVELYIQGEADAQGSGKTKKQAEQHAAEAALKRRSDVI